MEGKPTDGFLMSVDCFHFGRALTDVFVLFGEEGVGSGVLWEGGVLALNWQDAFLVRSLCCHLLPSVLLLDLPDVPLLQVLGLLVDRPNSLLKLVFLQFQKSFLLEGGFIFVLDLFKTILVLLMELLDLLDALVDLDLLPLNSVLVGFVEISLFSQLLPGALSLISNDFGIFEFIPHLSDLLLQFEIFVLGIGDQPQAYIVESALLLELVPLLLKDVYGVAHAKFLKEIPDKVVNDHVSLDQLRLRIHFESSSAFRP
jgi:hypothetical protein